MPKEPRKRTPTLHSENDESQAFLVGEQLALRIQPPGLEKGSKLVLRNPLGCPGAFVPTMLCESGDWHSHIYDIL